MTYPATNETSFEVQGEHFEINISIVILMYVLGLYIQIRIIMVSIEEKSKTWVLDIFHAVVMTNLFAIRIPFVVVGLISPNSFVAIESWICYIFTFYFAYGLNSMGSHSLIIAMFKYVFIVHSMKARAYGEDKIKNIFIFVKFALPLFFAIVFMINSYLHDMGNFQECFNPSGISRDHSTLNGHVVGSITGRNKEIEQYVVYLKIMIGFFQALLSLVTVVNVVEAALYFQIFKKLKRLVFYLRNIFDSFVIKLIYL